MKTIFILLLMFFQIQLSMSENTIENTSDFENIESKINKAFINFFINKEIKPLDDVIDELALLKEKREDNLVYYWLSFALYKKAIIYNKSDSKLSEKSNGKAIDVLESLTVKTSEEYALLAVLKNFDIQFTVSILKPIKATSITECGTRSIELDKNNIRGYLALAMQDFYTPKKWGGREKVESLLLKAKSLKESYSSNPAFPKWGREEIFYYLIAFYIEENKHENALTEYNEAIKEFPYSRWIQTLNSKIQK